MISTSIITRTFVLLGVCLMVVTVLPAQVEVLVADRSGGTVSAFDPGLTLIGTATLPPPADPLGVAVNPAGTLAAVANFKSHRVDFLDLTVSPPVVTGSSVSTVLTMSPFVALFPEDLIFSPDGACLLASDGRPGYVVSIDVLNRVLVSSLTTVQSQAVEFIPQNANNIVLTADQAGNAIHVLNLGAGCTLTDTGTTVPTPGIRPKNITALPNGQRALVAHSDGTVGVLSISGTTVSFVNSFVIGALNTSPPFPNQVQSFVVLPNGSSAYAYQSSSGIVEVLNIDASNNVTDSGIAIPVSTNLALLGIELLATDGHVVFVSTSNGTSSINVVNNKVTSTVAAGSVPAGIADRGTFLTHPLPPPHP